MFEFSGKGIYGAYAIGKAVVFKKNQDTVAKKKGSDVENEKQRLADAKEKAKQELDILYQKTMRELGNDSADIFEIHKMLLDDEDFSESICAMIDSERVNAEYAVLTVGEQFEKSFAAMQDDYMKERANDIKDITSRLIRILLGNENDLTQMHSGAILCAEDLTPGETAMIDKEKALAFLTEKGGYNSHTAILARNMNLPAVSGLPTAFFELVRDGDTLCVDGYTGKVILMPNDETLAAFTEKVRLDKADREQLQSLIGKENITKSGQKIQIYANIGTEEEVRTAIENDAGGIGLLRSEFSYLQRSDFPTEDELFNSYKRILTDMQGKKVIIRTLDIGADKQAAYFHIPKEENPAMGMRAVRICLTRPEIFKTQMRAILRASVYGNLGIMFPMITSEEEVTSLLALYEDVKRELTEAGLRYSNEIELGIMIETPAAAIISDRLAPMVSFFSVGTNDLTQYTLACDRQNADVERFANPHHEAIFRLIQYCVDNIHAHGGWIGICGELASDTSQTDRFLKMGIDELSVSPTHILKLRKTVLKL